MSEPDEYARAVIRKALEETGVTGDLDAAVDLAYRMLLSASMLQSAYWPRGYIESIRGAATPMGTCDQNCMCRG